MISQVVDPYYTNKDATFTLEHFEHGRWKKFATYPTWEAAQTRFVKQTMTTADVTMRLIARRNRGVKVLLRYKGEYLG